MKLLVFLHGMGQMPQTWMDQVTAMPDGYKAVAPWIKGLRPGRLAPFCLDDAVNDLWSLLNQHGVEQMALVGTGLGATVSLAAAVRSPETISHLVLEGVQAHVSRRGMRLQKTVLRAMPQARWRATGLNRESVLSIMDELAGLDLRPELPKVTAQTVLVTGDRDPQSRHMKDIARAIPHARLEQLEGVSQQAHLESPEQFNLIMYELFASPRR